MAADSVSSGSTFFGIGVPDSTGAQGTSGKGTADPSQPNSNLFGASGDFFHTGAQNIGSASPVDTSANDDGGTTQVTNPFGILYGSNAPDVTGTTATTAGDPDGKPAVGNQPDQPDNLLGGKISHFHN
jgi:hypothetical protein